jgi:hypothetical protein
LGGENEAEGRCNRGRNQIGRQRRECVSIGQPLRQVQGTKERGIGGEDHCDAADIQGPPTIVRALRNSGRYARNE